MTIKTLKTFKVILVDDHKMFRHGLKLMIENENIGTVIAEAENGQQFLDILEIETPDVVLMDIDMPVMNGLMATEKAVSRYPEIKIIGLSMFADKKFYTKMLKAGAKGFLLKKSGVEELFKAIKEVANGESYFSNELLRKIIVSLDVNNPKNDSNELGTKITDRDMEILQLLANGYSTFEIADSIHLSPKTVDTYRSRLIAKTGTKNTVDLIIYAIKNNLISIH